jgi:hypothetical protein
MVLFLLPVTSDSAEIQMFFRGVHSPLQYRKEERRERGKSSNSGKDLAEAARQ